ncbi:deoxyguanosinetriphosphate triphosphohydrolase family protein [Streptomyces agglomeratus]|uniref:deoxyguanosinetriphosphate triphosphohydrolase family protein n=1 Tax=Streptomyces agglomeratus TaxID=285458 RepID=UPI00099FD9F4|nr:dNTP triphosphohydrolase [Streptomyces agglomeratus]
MSTENTSRFHSERRHGDPNDSDPRSPFERDRDRVLYSSAFRRLAGVTQVAAVRERHLLHNRLTHSLKVAQVGRRMAQRLCKDHMEFHEGFAHGEDFFPDVVEVAGLAHDIGHPPFGHTAETVLREKMSRYGGFEGNAQTFRVLTKLAVHAHVDFGLNLTRESLNAVLKYPRYAGEEASQSADHAWPYRERGGKWGVYRSEEQDFIHARKGTTNGMRSLAAVLMDWADDVSYVTHDLHDYFRGGLMPLHSMGREGSDGFLEFAQARRKEGYEAFDEEKFEQEYEEVKRLAPSRKWQDTRDDRKVLDRFMHELLGNFLHAVSPVKINEEWHLHIEEAAEYQVEVIKELTFFHVINRPSLAMVQRGQRQIITRLFDDLLDMFHNHRNGKRDPNYPVPVLMDDIYDAMVKHERVSKFTRTHEERRARAVCDYICALTEDQAINLYECITGQKVAQGSIFGTWF